MASAYDRRMLLVSKLVFWASYVLLALTDAIWPDIGGNGAMGMWAILGFTLIVLAWARYDAAVRGQPLSRRMALGIVLLAGGFIPIYLIRTRGVGGFLKASGVFILQLIGALAAFVAVLTTLELTGITSIEA